MRRSNTGVDGDHHAPNAKLLGQTRGMQRRSAAKRDQRAFGGVLAVFDRMDPCGAGHGFVDDFGDAARRFLDVHAQRTADVADDRVRRQLRRQADLAAGESGRVDAPQHDIGIRHGRRRSAAAVAGGTRVRSRAVGADGDAAQTVHARDRSAAGTDLHHVDHRNPHRNPTSPCKPIRSGNLEMPRLLRGEIVDQRDLRRCAAHVEAQGTLVAAQGRDTARQDHAAGRPALHQPHGIALSGLDGADAAGGHHQQQRADDTDRGEAVAHAAQIAGHQRQNISVGNGRGGPFVFADLPADFAGEGNRQLRHGGREDLARAFLVRRVDVGMEETDRHGLDALGTKRIDKCQKRGFVERQQHGPVRRQPLGHLQTQIAFDQRDRSFHVQIVLLEPVLVGDFQGIPEAFGGDQRCAGAFALDQGVGGQGGAVNHQIEIAAIDPGFRQDAARPFDHGRVGCVMRRQQFGRDWSGRAGTAPGL